MHRGRPVGEPLDHRPPGRIRQSRKCCTEFIHNRMVVDLPSMSTADFAILDYCSLISLNLTVVLWFGREHRRCVVIPAQAIGQANGLGLGNPHDISGLQARFMLFSMSQSLSCVLVHMAHLQCWS
jgi:hypothetical protein